MHFVSEGDEPAEDASGTVSSAEKSTPPTDGAPSAPPGSGDAPSSAGSPASGEAESQRQEWREGPDDDAPPESWLGLDDDDLLHRIETADPEGSDDRLMEVVESDRHFFVRQEAAKRVRDHSPLFRFEDDRYIGQILVRHLTRREDVTYLERLVERSHHVEVRAAAQVQLARLWGRLGGPTRTSPSNAPALPPPEFREAPSASSTSPGGPGEDGRVEGGAEPAQGARDDVDASLLGWALHFVVEEAWSHLGTTTTRGILRRTHAELLPANESLGAFRVEDDAHVAVDLRRGARLSRDAVDGVARWLVAFLDVASRSADGVGVLDVRVVTRLMGDALDGVGFYEAVAAAWSAKR